MTDLLLATSHVKGPEIDWAGLSPLLAALGGSLIVLMVALFPGRFVQRMLVPFLALGSMVAGIAFVVWQWDPVDSEPIVAGALAADTLVYGIAVLCFVT